MEITNQSVGRVLRHGERGVVMALPTDDTENNMQGGMNMQEIKHTRGPWQVNYRNPFQVCDADGELRGCAPIATMRGTAAEKRANARRIVACVNACEGIGTEDIEAGISLADLLEALKAISGGQVMREKELGYTHADVVVEYQRIASAAIANATMTGPCIAELVESGSLTPPPRQAVR